MDEFNPVLTSGSVFRDFTLVTIQSITASETVVAQERAVSEATVFTMKSVAAVLPH